MNGKVVAYYDWNTKNKSFIRFAKQLKEMGVKNYAFCMTLFDKGLSGVDPFDPDISQEMQARIIYECSRNKFYFLRELCKVVAQGTDVPLSYEAHLGNMSLHFLRELNVNTYLELPRQCGKSIGSVAEYAYTFLFSKNVVMGHFSYNNKMVTDNIQRILDMMDLLPVWMHFHRMEERTNPNNPDAPVEFKKIPDSKAKKLSITNRIQNNRIDGKTPGLTEAQANTAGRGATMLQQWWDEPCDTHNFDIAADAAFPSFVTVSNQAKEKGIQYSIMLTSTPPDVDSKEGKYLFTFVKVESSKWNPAFFDYSPDEIEQTLSSKKRKFFYITFQWDEIGKSVAWLEDQLSNLSPRAIRKDIFLMWEKDIVGNPFEAEDLNVVEDAVFKHGHYEELQMGDGYHLKIYCNKNPKGKGNFREVLRLMQTRRLIIASDVAGGTGGNRDSSTLVAIDPVTTDLIFTFDANTMDTHKFAQFITKVVKMYAPRSLVGMERNSYGWSVLCELADKQTGIPNNLIYVPLSDDQLKRGEFGLRGKKTAGIWQMKTLRNKLYTEILGKRIQHFSILFRSEDIYNEVCTLEERNGRIDHKNGAHDDLLMAFCIAHYIISDIYVYVTEDYPDVGLSIPVSDEMIRSEIARMYAGVESPENINNIVASKRDVESRFDNVSEPVNMNGVTKDYMNINQALNIIEAQGDDFRVENINKMTLEDMIRLGESANERARVKAAKELGMSNKDILLVKQMRESMKKIESEVIDVGEDGTVTRDTELEKARALNRRNTVSSFF